MSKLTPISDIPVALLAGGLATRLGGISRETPKALADINGLPFIDYQLALLHRHGIRKVVLCIGHLGDQIEAHLGDGATRGMHIRYSYDGPTLAGTGGSVRRALPLLGDLFWVMYGDSYMDIDYHAVLQHFGASTPSAVGLMTVLRNDNAWDQSNAVFENGRLTCYDKGSRSPGMRHIDYGVQLLRGEAFDSVKDGERCDLAHLYRGIVARNAMIGYEVFTRFYEIGTPQSLEETRRHLSRTGHPPMFQRNRTAADDSPVPTPLNTGRMPMSL